jgi:hypothetical protein
VSNNGMEIKKGEWLTEGYVNTFRIDSGRSITGRL